MKRYAPAILSALLILLITAGALSLSSVRRGELEEKSHPEPPVYAVFTDTAKIGTLVVARKYVGVVEARSHSTISFRVAGQITTAEKDAGDRVDGGVMLAKVDARPLERQTQALEAELEGARSERALAEQRLSRRRPLMEKGHIDRDAFEEAKTAYETAKSRVAALSSRLASARIDLAYATVYAPFDGLITRRYKQQGDLAMPGEPVYAMENPADGFRVIARIPRETALSAAPADRVLVRFDGREIGAALFRIHPSTTERGLAAAEIRLEDRPFDLPTGSFVDVEIPIAEASGILVSGRSVLESDAGAQVFRIDNDNRVHAVNVTVKARRKEQVILSGPINPGDRLVRAEESMLLRLADNQTVRPMPFYPASHDRSSENTSGSSGILTPSAADETGGISP